MADLEQRLLEHFGTSHSIQFELRGGGMSRVFVAEDVALKRKVVIKVLNPALAATVSVQRFQREISMVAKLNHPNIVPVLTAGEVDSLPYFIMPYIEGESLRGRIGRGPLSLRETVAILKDVMRALAYAHSAGIVHRDIKPDNILLAGNAALVTDFGVAKAVSAARERGAVQPGQTITGVGISLGTPQYMAPEQAAADPNADARADFYALGIVAYEMLVGSPPFHGRTPQALLAAQLTELPPPLASRRYDVPIALSNLIMKCLEKDPADRPRSASELVHVLESPEALSGPVAATPEAVAKKRWRLLTTAFSVLLATTLLGALVVWSLWPGAPPPAATVATAPATTAITVRVNPVVPIGPESTGPAAAMSAAIESSLLRAGLTLAGGTSRAAVDSNTILVETTLQRAGDRARALVRVLTSDPAVPVWADQLDFRVVESFAAQDTLAARVLRAVNDARARLQ
ncbi:MAG TPA: serine/threonine-protein kinase [Gemmatimonadaceae bacterium]|nr:serine/threonine-protein kinase [Gemmatimonadaceae bacterium]